MATYNKFTPAIETLFEGSNAGSDTWVIKLATAVNQSAGTITEVANGNGYTTGGNTAYYCGLNTKDYISERWEFSKENAVIYSEEEHNDPNNLEEGEEWEELD